MYSTVKNERLLNLDLGYSFYHHMKIGIGNFGITKQLYTFFQSSLFNCVSSLVICIHLKLFLKIIISYLVICRKREMKLMKRNKNLNIVLVYFLIQSWGLAKVGLTKKGKSPENHEWKMTGKLALLQHQKKNHKTGRIWGNTKISFLFLSENGDRV